MLIIRHQSPPPPPSHAYLSQFHYQGAHETTHSQQLGKHWIGGLQHNTAASVRVSVRCVVCVNACSLFLLPATYHKLGLRANLAKAGY